MTHALSTRAAYVSWPGLYAMLAALLFIVALAFNGPLTATMTRHMFVHIPMLLFAGMLVAHALTLYARTRDGGKTAGGPIRGAESDVPRAKSGPTIFGRLLAHYRSYDEFGLPGLLLASLAGACWMIPRTLDLVLVSGIADTVKFASLFLLGLVLYDSLSRANTVIKLFFLGNFCWMAAVVGIVYQNNPARLCNFYLLGDQETAGIGLVILSIVLPLAWLLSAHRCMRRFLRN